MNDRDHLEYLGYTVQPSQEPRPVDPGLVYLDEPMSDLLAEARATIGRKGEPAGVNPYAYMTLAYQDKTRRRSRRNPLTELRNKISQANRLRLNRAGRSDPAHNQERGGEK